MQKDSTNFFNPPPTLWLHNSQQIPQKPVKVHFVAIHADDAHILICYASQINNFIGDISNL